MEEIGNEMEHDFSSYMNNTMIDTTFHFVRIDEEQTLTIIRQLKPKKSMGYDCYLCTPWKGFQYSENKFPYSAIISRSGFWVAPPIAKIVKKKKKVAPPTAVNGQ